MNLMSSKYQSLKGLFYGIFLIGAGSLFVSYHHFSLSPEAARLYHVESKLEASNKERSLNRVEIWRMVLEGTEQQSTDAEWNLTDPMKNRNKNIRLSFHPDSDVKSSTDRSETHFDQKKENSMEEEEEEEEEERKESAGKRRRRKEDCNTTSACSTTLTTTLKPDQEVAVIRKTNCKQDLSTLSDLAEIYTEPELRISPLFNTSVTEYYTTVDHDLIVIRIKGFAVNCQAEVRLADRYGTPELSNYTLGVGLNKVRLVVVDLLHSEPWILNTYTLNIYRLPPGELLRRFDASLPHEVCYLQQDCGLSFMMNEPCGLQPYGLLTWNSYLSFSRTLVPCNAGVSSGQWVLPCGQCGRKETCFWQKAVWQPLNCSHFPIARLRLRNCLSGKKVLFMGDSTNRGMMHYLLEQVNGSLMEWDKTHDSRVFSNINRNKTSVSFAYYPQFWLPTNERPLFREALLNLLKISQPLVNSRETVLVVGGVHWLSASHLSHISAVLQQTNLSDIRVIVKTLGAGFHLHVEGLHHLTLVEQRRLALHNALLVSRAQVLGYHVVETFNMTMARYKDFVQGKCACHFHRIKEVLSSFTKFMQHSAENGERKPSDMPIHFHIEGDVNAVYSEILLSRICDRG